MNSPSPNIVDESKIIDEANSAVATSADPSSSGRRRGFGFKAVGPGLRSVGKTLNKINLLKLIDDMEHDQELADKLDRINQEVKDENQRKDLVRKAIAECHAEIAKHLDDFLEEREAHANNPFAPSYEEWIADLHPENVVYDDGNTNHLQVDLRFFVEKSDHRVLWNQRMEAQPHRQVKVRTYEEYHSNLKRLLASQRANTTDSMSENSQLTVTEQSQRNSPNVDVRCC